MHTQGYGLCMQPHKPEPPTHTVSTTHQARWAGQLTWETRHSVMGHVLMLIIRLTRSNVRHQGDKPSLTCTTWLRYIYSWDDLPHGGSTLPAKERNNHNDTTCSITSHGRQGHSLPQGHPPHTTSKLPLQTNSVLSIVMSTSSKRHWQDNPPSSRLWHKH